jgi:glycosyltransferase involved in cell wall biosynthesis
MAINRLNLSGYNLILSSSHAVAKGVSKKANQLHLSYIHTPMRYAWDLRKQYLTESGLNGGLKGFLVNRMLDYIKKWDLKNTSSVDAFMANSHFIAGRIKNNYGRDAQVIYPPVKVVSFPFNKGKDDFYLTASRFVPYKRIDLIVESFNRLPNRNLVVIGDGPDWEKVKFKANKNVSLIGYAENDLLKEYMRRARAFVFAAEEDFGIAVVEAQACGTPVVAFGRGGALETVISIGQKKPTGVFFQEQKINSLIDGIENFEKHEKEILPENCRENALRFTPERFRKEFTNFVESQWNIFQGWN